MKSIHALQYARQISPSVQFTCPNKHNSQLQIWTLLQVQKLEARRHCSEISFIIHAKITTLSISI